MKKPTFLGKYLLLERINVGGMAEIFIAKSFGVAGFERILAIKKILPTMAEDDEFIRMFIDEARISAQLNHANIVHIHELGRSDDKYFIAMEYVAGRDVRTLIESYPRRRQTMPAAQAVFIASKMCEGLDYAHRRKDARGQDLQIVHRDVSPQNILISYEGEVKIIDFGVAKAANRTQQTQAGILKGKFGYMSPEQVRGQPVDRRSDVFAVGVILYEMLTGEKLFVGESDFSTLEKVRNAEVPLPTRFNPDIPPGLERVLLKALEREPEARYQWASELQEDLMRFLLTGETIYSSKLLSGFMKDTFAEELRREAERMHRYAGAEGPQGAGAAEMPPARRALAPDAGDDSGPRPAAALDGTRTAAPSDSAADATQIYDSSEMEAPREPGPGPVLVDGARADHDARRSPPESETLDGAGAREQIVLGASNAASPGETVIGRAPRCPAASPDDVARPTTRAERVEQRPSSNEPESSTVETRVQANPPRIKRTASASLPRAAATWWMARPRPQRLAALAGAALLGCVLGAALLISSGAPESGSILVLVRPADRARVEVNGEAIAPNAIVQLPLGRHLLRASAPGFAPLERHVTVAAGTTPPVVELNLSLDAPAAQLNGTDPVPAPPESAPAQGPAAAATFAARFVGEPGAEVQVDGTRVGRTPDARLANLSVGRRYDFTVTRAGFKPFAGQFRSESTAQLDVAFELEREVVAPTADVRQPEAAEPRTAAGVARAPSPRALNAPKGRFACSTRPAGAQVWVDGRDTGRRTPIALGNPLLLAVGEHRVVFKLNGKQTAPTSVTITPDAVAKLINVPID